MTAPPLPRPPRPDPVIAARLAERARADEVVSRVTPWLLEQGRWWPHAWPPALTAGVLEARRGYRFRPENLALARFLEGGSGGAGPQRICDLGAGSGSLLLVALYLCAEARGVGLERQPGVAERLGRTLEAHALGERAVVVGGDLREGGVLEEVERALGGAPDLVVANPPWYPAGWGRASVHDAVHASTHALAGGARAFLDAAARLLAPQGRCLVVYDAERLAELAVAAGGAGLALRRVLWLPDGREDRWEQPTRVWLELGHAREGGAAIERL